MRGLKEIHTRIRTFTGNVCVYVMFVRHSFQFHNIISADAFKCQLLWLETKIYKCQISVIVWFSADAKFKCTHCVITLLRFVMALCI